MRKAWLDYLRVFAVLAVITGHIVVDFYKRYGEVSSVDWWLSNILGTVLRLAVPMFVMTSGAVLLGRTYTVWDFYSKRAVRLIPPIIFWNLIYLGWYILDGMDTRTVLWTLKALLIVNGYIAPHLWYLAMYVCLMLFVPFINKFIMGEKPAEGELIMFLGATVPFFFLNTVASVADNIYGLQMDWFTSFPWYCVYFVAGYFIDHHSEKFPINNSLIVFAILVLIATGAGLNYYAVSSLGILKDYFIITEMGPLVFFMSLLVFLLAKKMSHVLVENKFISAVAQASFGMYLIHEIFNGLFNKILPDYYSHGSIYIPGIAILTALLSFTAIYLLRKIPLMRRVC